MVKAVDNKSSVFLFCNEWRDIVITSLMNFFIVILTTFLTGTAYFVIFLFWSMLIAYFLRKQGFMVFEVADVKDVEKEKTEKQSQE